MVARHTRMSDVALSEHVIPLEADLGRRRELGIFYTPRSAAALLARWAIRTPKDTVLEPSFGGCTILEAAVDRLRSLGCQTPPQQLFGFDIDGSAFTHLRRIFGQDDSRQFCQQDFLQVTPGQPMVTALIANPPFVSYHRMTEKQRDVVRAWRDAHSPGFPMTASLWAYFITHALSFLTAGGRLAFVLPSAAASADYAKPIIEDLRRRFTQLRLFRLSEQLFIQGGAEERTILLLAEGYSVNPHAGCVVEHQSAATIAHLKSILQKTCLTRTSALTGAQPPVSSATTTVGSIAKLTSQGTITTLGDIAKISIGDVLGDTGFFAKARSEWHALGIPSRHLTPIVTRTRQLPGLRVSATDINGTAATVPFLLMPPKHRIPKGISEYLQSYSDQQRSNNKTFAKRDPWYCVTPDRTSDGFLGSLSHGSPRIFANCAHVACANGLYKIALHDRHVSPSWLAITSLTTLFRLSAELEARVRGSGALKLEPSNARKLLIPKNVAGVSKQDLQSWLSRLDALIRKGEYESASRIADELVLIKSGAITQQMLRGLRDEFQNLQSERLLRKVR